MVTGNTVSSLVTSVRGTLQGVGPDWADVSLGGLTLRVSVPSSAVEGLGKTGDVVRLSTSLQVREDSLTLFGFPTDEQCLAFETLLGISGVGPRVALSVLSRFTPGDLAAAVRNADTDAFGGVAGVGRKTASRIVLELKGKLDRDWALPPEAAGDPDVVEALTALGYTAAEAREATASLQPGDSLSVEERVLQALQRMGSL